MKLGSNIRLFRFLNKEMTQEELAKAVQVTRVTIHSIEKGHNIPSALLAFRIARFFKRPFEETFFAAVVYLFYSLIMVYALGFSFERNPALPALSSVLSGVAALIFSLLFQKKKDQAGNERAVWYRSTSSFWVSCIIIFVLMNWIFYDFGFHGRLRWELIIICVVMALAESVSWIVYSFRN